MRCRGQLGLVTTVIAVLLSSHATHAGKRTSDPRVVAAAQAFNTTVARLLVDLSDGKTDPKPTQDKLDKASRDLKTSLATVPCKDPQDAKDASETVRGIIDGEPPNGMRWSYRASAYLRVDAHCDHGNLVVQASRTLIDAVMHPPKLSDRVHYQISGWLELVKKLKKDQYHWIDARALLDKQAQGLERMMEELRCDNPREAELVKEDMKKLIDAAHLGFKVASHISCSASRRVNFTLKPDWTSVQAEQPPR